MVDVNLTMTFRTVPCARCGIIFGVTQEFDDRKRNTHEGFFCPSGHSLSYPGESDAQRLADAARKLEESERRERLAVTEKLRIQTDLRRLRKRIKNGVCPCCKRSFTNIHAHIKTKHPEYK